MSERASSFGLFSIGAALFFAGYLGVAASDLDFPLLLETLTVLFGLPFVLRELRRQTNWLLAAHLILVIPALHGAAMEAASWVARSWSTSESAMFWAGLAGGFVGALSLLPLAFRRLRSSDPRWGLLASFGIVTLALIGGLVLGFGGNYALLAIYPLWQLPFGWFLSRLIRTSPQRP